MTKFAFFLLLTIVYTSCGESKEEPLQLRDIPKRDVQKLSAINWTGIPPLVGDAIEACPQCENPAGIIVHRAPFALRGIVNRIAIDSGSSLRKAQIIQVEGYRRKFAIDLYRRTLEKMQAVGGDSAYFIGKIEFKLVIGENGLVESAQIISSNTDMPKFDRKILDAMKTWKFPKAEGKTVVTFPYEFVKTKYPRGFVDTTVGAL